MTIAPAAAPKQKKTDKNNPLALYPEEFQAKISSMKDHADRNEFALAVADLDSSAIEFAKGESSAAILRRIEKPVAELKTLLEQYGTLQSSSAKINFQDYTDKKNMARLEEYFEGLSKITNRVRELGTQIQTASSSGNPYYLSRFILGISELENSGLANVLELQYKSQTASVEQSVYARCIPLASSINQTLNIDSGSRTSEDIKAAFQAADQIEALAEQLREINKFQAKLKQKNASAKARQVEFNSSMNAIATICEESKKILSISSEIQEGLREEIVPPADPVTAIRSEQDEYSHSLVESAKKFTAWEKVASSCAKSQSILILRNIKNEDLAWNEFIPAYSENCRNIEAKCRQKAIALWVAIADYYAGAGKKLYEDDRTGCEKIKKYMEGTDGVYYPSRSLEEMAVLRSNILKDTAALEDCKVKLNNGYVYRSNFVSQQETISENSKLILSLKGEFESLEGKAKERILAAQIASDEVEYLSQKARDANEDGSFDSAIKTFLKADDAYSRNSEELKNDGDIRDRAYSSLAELRENIITTQQPIFAGESRSLKNRARTEYYAGNFEEAASCISMTESKRELWSRLLDNEMETDEELERLKDYVNTAIAIKEGREIHSYDAKSPEMRQNLSLAEKYYESGSRLMAEEKKSEAQDILQKAKDRINHVKIYYPRNKAAGVLGLKIDKLLDPENFDNVFAARFRELSETDYSTKSARAQEAYGSLLDLRELNPDYPGMKKLIEKAEVQLGLKPQAPDRSKIDRADKLASEAKAILAKAGRDEILLAQAKQKAQEAFSLDPGCAKAIAVLDEIAMRQGGDSRIVLSREDEMLYQSALADLQKNKVFDANSKIAKILANPNNSNSAKVLKLKKRIEARL